MNTHTFRTDGLGGLFGRSKGEADERVCGVEGGGSGERLVRLRFSGDGTGILITHGKPSAYCK